MERHDKWVGRLLILKKLGGPRNMTSYDVAMFVIAILSLIVNAVALFQNMKK